MVPHSHPTGPSSTSRCTPPGIRTSLPALLLLPPYERAEPYSDVQGVNIPGAVLAVAVDHPSLDPHAIVAATRELSQRAPWCPAVVLLRMPPADSLEIAARLSPLPIRAVVPETASLAQLLRGALTDPTQMPREVVAWLRRRSILLNANTVELVQSILTLAPDYPTVTSLLDRCHTPIATARFRMQKKNLPPPSRWFHAARALHAALYLQGNPNASAIAAAYRLGLTDHSSLVHLLRRTFRAGVREIRGTVGWEWLLYRWLSHEGTDVPVHEPMVSPLPIIDGVPRGSR
jgi:AraC-like DNA-binding protein